jgi:glycosyltransferase involved in cell wall biosynthesis
MHILIIPSWYITATNHHRGIAYREQGMAFVERGHQVGMLVPPSRFRTFHGLNEVRQYWRRKNSHLLISDLDAIPTFRIPWWGWIPSIWVPRRKQLILDAFDQYAAEYGRPDVIHARSLLYGGFSAALIKQHRHIPALVTEVASIFASHALQLDHRLTIRYSVKHLDKVLAISSAMKRALQPFVDTEITVVHNPINTTFFTPSDAPVPQNPFNIAIVGNLNRAKGHHILIDAFVKALHQHPDMELNIVGDGRERGNLEKQAVQLGVIDRINFHGRQPRNATRNIMQRSHVIVSASRHETFGMTLLEAIACGKPVIATQSGGPEDIVNENNGRLVPVDDVEALAAALREMAEHYERYDQAQIRADCVARFSEEVFTRRLEAIYREVRQANSGLPPGR